MKQLPDKKQAMQALLTAGIISQAEFDAVFNPQAKKTSTAPRFEVPQTGKRYATPFVAVNPSTGKAPRKNWIATVLLREVLTACETPAGRKELAAVIESAEKQHSNAE